MKAVRPPRLASGAPPPQGTEGARAARALQQDAGRTLVAVGLLVALLATATGTLGGLGLDHTARALLLYGLGATLVWRGLTAHPHARFGAANGVTLLRLASVACLAGLVGESIPGAPLADMPSQAWALVVIATITALCDAVDGALARRSGLASNFGARFDMETDAAFTLVLCALVLQAGQAGPWVLASGLMRYAFVAAARAWPWLAAALPPSKRRQTVCVVQITTLIVCLGPIVPPALAAALAAISLALLTLSFAIDVRTLARQRPTPPET